MQIKYKHLHEEDTAHYLTRNCTDPLLCRATFPTDWGAYSRNPSKNGNLDTFNLHLFVAVDTTSPRVSHFL